MSNGANSREITKSLSIRRRVNQRVLRFSVSLGLVGVVLASVVYFVPAPRQLQEAQTINQRALSQIDCAGSACNTSRYTTSWLEGPDYFIDEQTKYFIEVPSSQQENSARFPPLDFADTAFIKAFREPGTYTTPDGEIWRLYSVGADSVGLSAEIIVGYAQKAPWRILTASASEVHNVDTELKREAGMMAANLSATLRGVGSSQRLIADGFAVVNAQTGKIMRFGPWVPMFLAKDAKLPVSGRSLRVDDEELYAVQVDDNGRFTTVSLAPLGDIRWFGVLATIVFILTAVIARGLSLRFLRNYFAVMSVRVPSLDEACQSGEGQKIEFKRGLSEDGTKNSISDTELLRSIAAFANTNDGVIFMGVDDTGKIKGLGFDFRQKDRFEQKIRQLARTRIKPNPPIEISFTEPRGIVVARIVVARGEAPAYLLNGVVYVRLGSSDVQAQPEDLTRLFSVFA
jgi:hypothetical protein